MSRAGKRFLQCLFAVFAVVIGASRGEASVCDSLRFPGLSDVEQGQAQSICKSSLNDLIDRMTKQDPCKPFQPLLGRSCTTGCTACVAGKSIFDSIFGGVKDALEALVKGSFPGRADSFIRDIQTTIISGALQMWINSYVVDGILYPGGYSIECAGYGGSLNVNDKKWIAFSRTSTSSSDMCNMPPPPTGGDITPPPAGTGPLNFNATPTP